MLGVRVFPTLLYRGGGLCKGINFQDHRYVGDILNAIRIFNLCEVDELAVLDIGATQEGRSIAPELVLKISTECMMPLAVGGGIRRADEAKLLLANGAEKIILDSHVFENLDLVREINETSGSQSVVVSIDVKRTADGDRVFSRNGTRDQGIHPVAWATRLEEAGCGELLINSIDRDGTGTGYDLKLIQEVTKAVNIPVIALGGAGTLDHMKAAVDAGASAVTAGSMFVFFGRRRAVLINFPERAELQAMGLYE
jgi:cyclase